MVPSDTALPLLKPLYISPPPRLCGMGCYTSAVLTLTAPSLWCLISCSDTLSLYHANGPASLPACAYAISTLSKALENRVSQIRETYIHTAWIMRVWTTESERDNVCIWNKKSGGSARERERGVKRSTTNVVKADYKWEGERACLWGKWEQLADIHTHRHMLYYKVTFAILWLWTLNAVFPRQPAKCCLSGHAHWHHYWELTLNSRNL